MIIPPIRQTDAWGSGAFGASRGDREHRGVDPACYPGSTVLSLTHGVVRRIGYPYDLTKYPERKHLRLVEVELDGNLFRYFYLDPIAKVGQQVVPGTPLGVTQKLGDFFPGITEHFHLEYIDPHGNYIDPETIL